MTRLRMLLAAIPMTAALVACSADTDSGGADGGGGDGAGGVQVAVGEGGGDAQFEEAEAQVGVEERFGEEGGGPLGQVVGAVVGAGQAQAGAEA